MKPPTEDQCRAPKAKVLLLLVESLSRSCGYRAKYDRHRLPYLSSSIEARAVGVESNRKAAVESREALAQLTESEEQRG
jgi:hypothetical protein